MTPFWSFIIGAGSMGIILSIIFGILFMEIAYRKGYRDGQFDEENSNQVSEIVDWEHGSDV